MGCHRDLGILLFGDPLSTLITCDVGIPFSYNLSFLRIPGYPPRLPRSLMIWVCCYSDPRALSFQQKILVSKFQKFPRALWNGSFPLHRPNPGHRAFN